MSPLTPRQAWAELVAGNDRFVAGTLEHPDQSTARRAEISTEQHPFAVLFGCSDSRVAAEIIFDRGLGDMFVVRTAGHVVDTTVLGSIEYGIDVLGAPLVVVLGHDSCGAISAARHALASGEMPSGMIRAVVDRVLPSIVTRPTAGVASDGSAFDVMIPEPGELGRQHLRGTVRMLSSYSTSVAEGVRTGRCAVVGAEYRLADGRISIVETAGSID